MTAAATIVSIAEIWLIIGGIVAAVFLTIGIDRIDEDARGAYFFRPLVVPGVLLLWPLVLWRWWVLETGRENAGARYRPARAAHGAAAVILCAAVVALIAAGAVVRQDWPAGFAPQQLSAPEAQR